MSNKTSDCISTSNALLNEKIKQRWLQYTKLQDIKCKNHNPNKFTILLQNDELEKQKIDYLYHLALDTSEDLSKRFGDVKFVCMGGKAVRMKSTAETINQEIGFKLSADRIILDDITADSHRYSMYKVGPVLCVNHGMGEPSLTILLHEIFKLLYYAKAQDPIFFRLGTSGGLGVDPGTVVVAKKAVNGYLEEHYSLPILGKTIKRPTVIHSELADDLIEIANELGYAVTPGVTMSALDFYEGQGRRDGAFCEHTEEEKLEFLKKAHSIGVRNIEMEAAAFAALTYKAGIKAGVINATFLDRLIEDQVRTDREQLSEWEARPQKIVAHYIKKFLESHQ